jgi:NADPH-dependent 2,4-dienoyl-CoA reductase/sulfur reductase-like enzyme
VNKSKLTIRKHTGKRERIVVVGGGLAGLRAAERLREQGFSGELMIVGAERRKPYHRPALSKQLLTGELRPRDLTLRSYVPLDAIWRRGAFVLKLDARRHVVELAGDEEIRYDGLVIATGVQARHLPGAPRHDPRVHTLRTMGDAIALQRSIATGNGKVVVIGGGFTACEVASTARELGCEVTILSRSKTLLGKVVGEEMGSEIAELQRSHGVQVELGVEVTEWLTQPWGVSMHLSNGKVVVAGTVVLAVGSTPSVQWLRGSGLTLEDGVLCRPTCHVVGANDVVAAGDVARWPNLRFEAAPRRVEHWMNAVDMGRAAAESLLAGAAAQPFTPLPRFWSEQHGMHLQAAGMPVLSQDTLPLGRKQPGKGVTGYVRNGRLIGIVGRDSARDMLRWTEELKRELRRSETVTLPAFGGEPAAEPAAEPVAMPQPMPQAEAPRPVARPAPSRPAARPAARPAPRPEPRPEPRVVPEPEVVELTLEHPTMEHFFAELPAMLDERPRPAPDEQPTRSIPVVRATPPHLRHPVSRPEPRPAPAPRPLPSFPDMPRLPRDHPSLPGMRPVERPEPAQHPSLPNMHPVARPPDVWDEPLPEHPSLPNMHPVARPAQQAAGRHGRHQAGQSRGGWQEQQHPSMPGMYPVPQPMSDFERRREQQLLEWQFRLD